MLCQKIEKSPCWQITNIIYNEQIKSVCFRHIMCTDETNHYEFFFLSTKMCMHTILGLLEILFWGSITR